MRTNTCSSISDMLVAFDDGELLTAEVACVEAHLADCTECQRELAALRRSLHVARTQWQQGTLVAPEVTPVAWELSNRRFAIAAAAMLLVAITAGVWWLIRSGAESMVVAHRQVSQDGIGVESVPPQPLTIATVDGLLDDEMLAARLAASAAMLTEQSGAEEYGRRAYQYLARTFPNTSAGREAAALIAQTRENSQ